MRQLYRSRSSTDQLLTTNATRSSYRLVEETRVTSFDEQLEFFFSSIGISRFEIELAYGSRYFQLSESISPRLR